MDQRIHIYIKKKFYNTKFLFPLQVKTQFPCFFPETSSFQWQLTNTALELISHRPPARRRCSSLAEALHPKPMSPQRPCSILSFGTAGSLELQGATSIFGAEPSGGGMTLAGGCCSPLDFHLLPYILLSG